MELRSGHLQTDNRCVPCTNCKIFHDQGHGWCAQCNCVVRVKVCACVRAEFRISAAKSGRSLRDTVGHRAVCSRGWHTTRLPTSKEREALFILQHKALKAWRRELKNLVPELLRAHGYCRPEIVKNILQCVGFDHPWLDVEGVLTQPP